MRINMRKLFYSLPIACLLLLCAVVTFADNSTELKAYDWQGNINNKIPVSIWVEIKDGLVVGEIVYLNTSAKTPIRLLGTIEDKNLDINEMLPDGTIAGVISGIISGDNFTGTWSAPQKITKDTRGNFNSTEGKSFPMSLSKGVAAHTPFSWDFIPSGLMGKYCYSWGEYGYNGTIVLKASGNEYTHVEYEINAFTSAPSFNMAVTGPQQGEITGNRLLNELEEGCAFEMLFFNGFIVVRYLDGNNCFGYFGMNATVQGIFLKQP